MGDEVLRRVSSAKSQEVEDSTLESWDRAIPDAWSFREVPPREPEDPFDLEITKPHAVSIERLYEIAGKKVPAELRASLGASVPLLLSHGMTPFYKAGRKPSGVWGMGYRTLVDDKRCATVAVFPASRKYDVINVSEQVSFGIKAGGEIGIPEVQGFQLLDTLADIKLTGLALRATTNDEFAIAAQCTFSVLEVQAGPVDAGGARWNLYRGRESVEMYQPLFQTLLAPRKAKNLRFTIDTWIRGSGRFFGLLKARQWDYPSQVFEVSIESES
jgi:hypothetical protein